MNISDSIFYVGVSDKNLDLFEGQYPVPNGMSYNSYIIKDKKIAVLDTVDMRFKDEWLNNIKKVLGDAEPDYLVVHHMEPDHSSNIKNFLDTYKNCKVVSSFAAFNMMKNYFGTGFTDRQVVIEEGTKLDLGEHKLNFVAAPMVHWPEVHVSFEESEGILFSADGFGKFGVMGTNEPWDDEARRYYIGIVGMHGMFVQNLLKKASALPIKKICPLHGEILEDNLAHYIDLYDKWSGFKKEKDGVCIAYTTVYGHMKEAVERLASEFKSNGVNVEVFELNRCEMSEAVAKAFAYENVVLATTTYNNEIFPIMSDFVHRLVEHKFQNKNFGIMEGGTWAPQAGQILINKFKDLTNVKINKNVVTVLGSLNNDSEKVLKELANSLLNTNPDTMLNFKI